MTPTFSPRLRSTGSSFSSRVVLPLLCTPLTASTAGRLSACVSASACFCSLYKANYLHESIEKMEKDQIRLKILGDTTALSPAIQGLIDKTDAIAARLPGCFQANVCLNYGGRDEIVRAVNRFTAEHPGEPITEAAMAEYLDTAGIPDPDLIIRTGGEYRISNFLMWESAYSELYFTDVLWPDFSEKDIDEAVAEYRHRDRRFGGVKA